MGREWKWVNGTLMAFFLIILIWGQGKMNCEKITIVLNFASHILRNRKILIEIFVGENGKIIKKKLTCKKTKNNV